MNFRRCAPLLLLALPACASVPGLARTEPIPTGFPARCAPDEVQVMLLGTYHMANPGLDDIKQEVDDVLAPHRQRQLEQLSVSLARWRPDQIAVEHLASDSAGLHARYRQYLAGTLAPDRNETVQVAYRLARRLGHPGVYPVDAQLRIGNDSVGALFARRPDLWARSDSFTATLQRRTDEGRAAFLRMGIVTQLRESNTEAALHGGNSFGMFGALMPTGEGRNYGGPQVIARWYERNAMMVHHLHRVLRPGTRRILLVVGSGHVPPIRNLLDEDPRFCPVSPLPYLR